MQPAIRLLILARSNPEGAARFLQRHPTALEQRLDLDNTILHLACAMGHADTFSWLVSAGADLEAENCLGRTPLFAACECGHPEIARRLLSAGARFEVEDRQRRRPMHVAAGSGGLAVVRALLAIGAEVDPLDHLDFTPLFHALYVTPVHIAVQAQSWAEKQRAEANLPPPEPFDYEREDVKRCEMVTALLEAGARIDHVGSCGQTPLHRAAEVAHLCPGLYRLLLGRGADPTLLDANGEPASARLQSVTALEFRAHSSVWPA